MKAEIKFVTLEWQSQQYLYPGRIKYFRIRLNVAGPRHPGPCTHPF